MRDHQRLDVMRRAAEAAVGSMRQVAQHLDEIADALPRRESVRRLALHHHADRLKAAADLLTAEATAGEVRNVRRVARVAGVVLLGVGTVLGPGVAEGTSAALTERALEWQAQAEKCVHEVEQRADEAQRADDRQLFDVVLTGAPDGKLIPVLRAIRTLTNASLKEAKDLLESVPSALLKGVSKEEAANAKVQLEGSGATVEIN